MREAEQVSKLAQTKYRFGEARVAEFVIRDRGRGTYGFVLLVEVIDITIEDFDKELD